MRKNIAIIVDSIDVNDSSGSKANVAIINNLAAIGYNLTVFHYTQKDIQLKNISSILIKENKHNLLYVLSRAQRVMQRYFKLNLAKYLEPIFGFSFTYFNDVNSIKSALKKHDTSKFNLILTLSKGASFRPHYALNKLPYLHNKWLAYIHDPYPMSCYPPPYQWEEPGYKQKQHFFKEVSLHARNAAFPSQLLKDWVGSFFPNFIHTGIVIPHQNFEEEEVEDVPAPNYFDSTKFNILHAGNLMKQRNPEGLLKGFKLFLENKPEAKKDARLLLLGNADYHKNFIIHYVNNVNEIYVQLSNIPFSNVFWLQNKVAVNVILEAKSEISPFLPGKFPHCVAAKKPIIHLGPKHSETRRLLGENYPYWTDIDNAEAISTILQTLYELWTTNKNGFMLERPDLERYLGTTYLKEQIESVFNNV